LGVLVLQNITFPLGCKALEKEKLLTKMHNGPDRWGDMLILNLSGD
jgi:hypothetical protein